MVTLDDLKIKYDDMLDTESDLTVEKAIERIKEEYKEKINKLINEYNDMVIEYRKRSILAHIIFDKNSDELIKKIEEKKEEIDSYKKKYEKIFEHIKINKYLKNKQ